MPYACAKSIVFSPLANRVQIAWLRSSRRGVLKFRGFGCKASLYNHGSRVTTEIGTEERATWPYPRYDINKFLVEILEMIKYAVYLIYFTILSTKCSLSRATSALSGRL